MRREGALMKGFGKKEVKRPIQSKMAYLIIGATLFSLLMGMPIAYFKTFVLSSGVLDVFGANVKSLMETYFTLVINLVIMVLFVTIGVKRFVVNPINEIIYKLEGLNGDQIDLTQRMEVNTQDEFNKLATAFNDMISELTGVIEVVSDTSDKLAVSSLKVADSSNQVKDTTREIAENMNGLAYRSEEGNKSVADVSTSLAQLSSLIKAAQTKVKSTNEGSTKTLEVAGEGQESVQVVISKMNAIKSKMDEQKGLIEMLDQLSKEVTEAAAIISKMAEDTTHLSINASIEAARVGEAGKGFAVVAEEVGKLAKQSTERAGKVKEVVHKMVEVSGKTVLMTEDNQKEVLEGVEAVNQAEKALGSILKAISDMDNNMKELQGIASEELETSDHIVKKMKDVSTFIEETAANAEEVSASTEETVASIETVANTTGTLKDVSNSLNESVKQFKTK